MFDSAGPRHSSVSIRADLCFDFTIINAKSAVLLKYWVQKIADVLRDVSEIVGNSVLIPSQNSLNILVYFKLNSNQQLKQHFWCYCFKTAAQNLHFRGSAIPSDFPGPAMHVVHKHAQVYTQTHIISNIHTLTLLARPKHLSQFHKYSCMLTYIHIYLHINI